MTGLKIADEMDTTPQAPAAQVEQLHLGPQTAADQETKLEGSHLFPEPAHEFPVISRGNFL